MAEERSRMITMTYHLIYSEPTYTVLERLQRVMEQRKYSCVPLHLDDDEAIIYKIMKLSVDGNSVRLHSVTNPLTQYKKYSTLEKSGS